MRSLSSRPPAPCRLRRRPTLPSASRSSGGHAAASGRNSAGRLEGLRRRCAQIGGRKRLQRQHAAARADGWQEPPGSGGHEQEYGARRGLLQRLQKRVGGVDVELVGLIDDDDAPGRPHPRDAIGTSATGAPRRWGCWRQSASPSRHRGGAARADPDARARALGGQRWCLRQPRGFARWRRAHLDARAPHEQTGRRASPCRSPAGRRRARHGACGRR